MKLALAIALLASAACGDNLQPPGAWQWNLPSTFPQPRVPADNPMSTAKVELGRYLFYDARLSGNQTQACASCHEQARAFAGANAVELGSTGTPGKHNAMSLTNVAWNSVQTWANPALLTPEQQALVPMFGESPVELGLAGMEDALIARLRGVDVYPQLFAGAFPDDADPLSIANVARALASFDRALVSDRSPYDRFQAGNDAALSDGQKRGMELFFGERLECHHCHNGFNFTVAFDSADAAPGGFVHYFNDGLYNVDGQGAYPASDTGIMELTGDPRDMGRFRPPTLRNIAVTGPYMHDGSIGTLGDVLDSYARGGRLLASGPNAGDGATNPHKNVLLHGFTISPDERADVLSFLDSLTDQELLSDPALANPWAP